MILVIINRSEFPTMALRLQRENGSAVSQTQMPRNRRRWNIPVMLPVGRYRIIDENRPSLVCNIEITP